LNRLLYVGKSRQFNVFSSGGWMLEILLTVFFTLLALIGIIIASAYFWRWYYASPTQEDETVYVYTADGWRLALHHYRPLNGAAGKAPVILCHGLSANRYVFEIPAGPSLAHFLRHQGRDVWVAELRGSGMSARPGLWYSDVPYSWGFDDHLTKDLPAIMDSVLATTGASQIHWIGHSMGGMLMLAHLAGTPQPAIGSLVTLGSPVDFTKLKSPLIVFLLRLKPLLGLLPISSFQFLFKPAIPLIHRLAFYAPGMFHPDNIDPAVSKRMVALAAEVVTSSRIWLEFGNFVRTGLFGPPGGHPYLQGLSDSDVPIFMIGGSKDGLAPPEAVATACESTMAKGERKCMILGKASGCIQEYGHLDLTAGLHAREEIFQPILEWLQAHDKAN
jgi:pimeloyl-ACP methyl ester carboxylesterase